jgi:hypothetical protein
LVEKSIGDLRDAMLGSGDRRMDRRQERVITLISALAVAFSAHAVRSLEFGEPARNGSIAERADVCSSEDGEEFVGGAAMERARIQPLAVERRFRLPAVEPLARFLPPNMGRPVTPHDL